MKNPIFDYALKTIKSDKKSSVSNFFIYFTLTAFLIFSGILVNSYVNSLEIEKLNTYGAQDAIVSSVNEEEKDELLSEFQSSGVITSYGEYLIDNDETIQSVIVGQYDQNAADMIKLFVVDGEMPTKEGEIVIEKTLYNLIKENYAIGDTIEIYNDNIAKEYTIVGVLRNYSDLVWGNANDTCSMPSAFVYDENGLSDVDRWFISLDVADNYNLENLSDKNYVGNLISQEYSLFVNSASIWSIFVIVPAVIILILFILYALYAFEVYKMSKKIALLKIVGFTKKDCFKYYFYQLLIQIIPALILGSFVGYLASPWLISSFDSFIEPHMSFYMVIFATLFIFSSASLILVFSNAKTNKLSIIDSSKSKLTEYKQIRFTSKNPFRLYAVKNFILNQKQSNAITLSVFFAVIVLFIGLTSANVITFLENGFYSADVNILAYDGSFSTYMNIEGDPEFGVLQEDYELLKNLDEVKNAVGVKWLSTYTMELGEQGEVDAFTTVEKFQEDKRDFGLQDYDLQAQLIYSFDDEVLLYLEQYLIDGEIDIEKLNSGEHIIVTNINLRSSDQTFDNSYEVGDSISFIKFLTDENQNVYPVEFTSTVGGILNLNKDELSGEFKDIIYCNLNSFYCGHEWFDITGITKNYNTIYLNVYDSEQISELNKEIYSIQQSYENDEDSNGYFGVDQALQDKENNEKLSESMSVISLSIFLSLAAFSVVFIFLSISKVLQARKSLFGSLRACGMTQKQLQKLFIYQNMIPVIIGFILSIIVCITIFIPIYISGDCEPELLCTLPIVPLGILSIIYVFAVYLASVLPVKKFIKQSISQCLKSE